MHFSLNFDNSFLRELPQDPELRNFVRPVFQACASKVAPTPVSEPCMLCWSSSAGKLLELGPEVGGAPATAQIFSGNTLLPGMEPYATCYGGHQFGVWAGQLGDGRALSLGEVVNSAGNRWEIQLKGAGPTPYSRRGDGRAVLRSSLREFVVSEAMHHLGVPSTRALCFVATGDMVIRDQQYDGNRQPEPGAIVTRLAPTFLRFGHYELLAERREYELLKKLADYTIHYHHPELAQKLNGPDRYEQWLRLVAARTGVMIAHWMALGFVHGVMNTDNMSILGLTIDYGPFGWLDSFDPSFTPNTTDYREGRYRYGHQPRVALWNLERLSDSLESLIPSARSREDACAAYQAAFEETYRTIMGKKLGLLLTTHDGEEGGLLTQLFECFIRTSVDQTLFFRNLPRLSTVYNGDRDSSWDSLLSTWCYEPLTEETRSLWRSWLEQYAQRVNREGLPPKARERLMNKSNPWFIPRNYLLFLAIQDATQGNLSRLHDLIRASESPFDPIPGLEHLGEKRPQWAEEQLGCSALSCSS